MIHIETEADFAMVLLRPLILDVQFSLPMKQLHFCITYRRIVFYSEFRRNLQKSRDSRGMEYIAQ